MKNIILIFCACLFLNMTLLSQDIEMATFKKSGLVSYLTAVKTLSEFTMMKSIADSSCKDLDNIRYNKIKMYTDVLINQLSSDMTACNNVKAYKALNKYMKKETYKLPGRFSPYKDLFDNINWACNDFLPKKNGHNTEKSIALAAISDLILGVAEQTIGVSKEIRELKGTKVAGLVSQLNELKLKSKIELSEQIEKGKKDNPKKPTDKVKTIITQN